MLNSLLNHRSVRKFQKKEIDNEILNEILHCGIRASTTGNMQVYSMIVTKSQEIKKHLWESHFKQNMVLEAPVHITFCADFNRFNKWCVQRDASPGYNNFLSFFTAAIDALLVAQNVCIAAEAKNIGICYLGTATYNADKIISTLNIPKLVVPVAAIVLGYSNDNSVLTDRLPIDAVVHNETYSDYNPDKINQIYNPKENLDLYKKLISENQKDNLAQIFTDLRYTKKDNLFFSKKFLDTLEKQGFMNHDE